MVKTKTQKDFFRFLNKNKIMYVVTRGSDKKSKELGKDLDILIHKKDYEKFKNKIPKIDRVVDFYIDKESHGGMTFVSKKAIKRRVYDKDREFFILSKKDYRRMIFLRAILKKIRKVKGSLGMYKK